MSVFPTPWTETYRSLGIGGLTLSNLPDLTLSDYVREHARRLGEREALVFLGQSLSYADLDRLADRFAGALLASGCQPGEVLGIHLPNTPQLVVALVAAARIGVVVTCISPITSAQECIAQAQDARLKVLLTSDDALQTLVPTLVASVPSLSLVLLSTPTELLADGPKAFSSAPIQQAHVHGFAALLQQADPSPALPSHVPADAVLYVMYTGGTTGMPKGARLSSRNMLVTRAQLEPFFRLRDGAEIVASAFPVFHIGGLTVLLNALCTASTFVLIPNPRDVEHLCDEMEKRPPTILAALPTLLQVLVTRPSFSALDFSALRLVISGAAPLVESEVEKLEVVIGRGKICDVYGMTETAGVQTINPSARFKPGFVGVPVPGTDVRVVNEAFEDVAAGEPGEIVVSGPQVMHSYVNTPEETRTALQTIDGRVWVHTGDVGAFDGEGYLKIFDRSKDMLIVGGFKVFSVEVENQLRDLPFIEGCALVGRADLARPGNDVVHLYVQRVAGDAVSQEEREHELLAFCRASLAPYKVPKEIHFVDSLPLTRVGKVDKRALRSAR
ncbi:MAG: AMP-binding protein [Polyangiales bacterium]